MGSKEFLKKAFIDVGVSSGEVADLMGYDRQVFYNKLSRNSMSFKEVTDILNTLGLEVIVRPIK